MPIFSCKICFEDLPDERDKCVLSKCSHECCRSCLQMLVRSTGQQPVCPFCRTKVAKNDIRSIQQQQQPRQRRGSMDGSEEGEGGARAEEEEGVDEYTRHWLQENTTRCPRCESYVEQTENVDSNDDTTTMVECLCGCSFCVTCGAEESNCRCGSATRSNAAWGRPSRRHHRRTTAAGWQIREATAAMMNARTTAESRRAFLQRLFDRPTPPTLPQAGLTARNSNNNGRNHPSEEMDEDTRQWLRENTRACPRCRSPIERMDDSNEMSCLCGCSFCFACGSERCNCSSNGDFETLWWQRINVVESDSDSTSQEEEDGFDSLWNRLDVDVDLASYILFEDNEVEEEGGDLEELRLEHTNNTLLLEQAQNTNIGNAHQINNTQQQEQLTSTTGAQATASRPLRRRQLRRTGRVTRGERRVGAAASGRSRMQRQRQREPTTRNGQRGNGSATVAAASSTTTTDSHSSSRTTRPPPRFRRVRHQVQQIERRTSAAGARGSRLAILGARWVESFHGSDNDDGQPLLLLD